MTAALRPLAMSPGEKPDPPTRGSRPSGNMFHRRSSTARATFRCAVSLARRDRFAAAERREPMEEIPADATPGERTSRSSAAWKNSRFSAGDAFGRSIRVATRL